MSERKYTYEQIVRALECCQYRECQECIRLHTGRPIEDDCRLDLIYDSLTLINRQKAEIERLKADRYMVRSDGSLELIPRTDTDKIRAEAIKEFAERVKEVRGPAFPFTSWVHISDIDLLVAEMTEGQK